MTDNARESKIAESERAATIASLWAALTEAGGKEGETGVFLLMFGPWGKPLQGERES